MKEKQGSTYHCDYCKEYYLRKSACERHETYCRLNPNNRHKCFQGCIHLKRWKDEQGHTVFTCNKLDKDMYSYILERRINSGISFETFMPDAERMPLECEHFDNVPF